MLKFLEMLDHLEKQISAGRDLIDVARTLPSIDELALIDLEEELDQIENHIAEIDLRGATMADADALNKDSGELYERLMALGKLISS